MSAEIPQHMLPKRTQAPCCYGSAMEQTATWCGECGKPLLRCMSFEECGGLLDDNALCTVCVAPHIQIAPGAVQAARVGGAVALPMTIANYSAIGRPLFVTSLWVREGNEEWVEQDLGWENLKAGESRPVTIRAKSFDRPGVHNVQCLIAVASRWRWREECFAFTTELTFDVQDKESKQGPIVNIGGDSSAHGNIVQITDDKSSKEGVQRSEQALDLQLVRAEKEERRLGLRGMENGEVVPRNVRVEWKGFPDLDVPMDGPFLTADGIVAGGRSRSLRQGGLGDFRILPEKTGGVIDEDLSLLLSRRHMEIYIECDRLVLRVTGRGGVRVNGEAYGRDKIIILNDGDEIAPLVDHQKNFFLKTQFQTNHRQVDKITITRAPASIREVN